MGVILILYELGEYELVLKIIYFYFFNNSIIIKDGCFGDLVLVLLDVVFIVVLVNLELGREEW